LLKRIEKLFVIHIRGEMEASGDWVFGTAGVVMAGKKDSGKIRGNWGRRIDYWDRLEWAV
jgi:hypothetical protein